MPSPSEARALLAARVAGPSTRRLWIPPWLLLWLSTWLLIALAASAYSAVLEVRLQRLEARSGAASPSRAAAPIPSTQPTAP